MTLYLTDNTPPAEVAKAAASGFVKAVKLYPAGATTNSDAGLTDIAKAYATLAEMERVGLPLLVHGEVTDPKVDLFRPREGLHRHRAAAADPALSRS
jgi:dihydroorotase